MENFYVLKIICVTVYVLVFVQISSALNLGLISGDLKRTSSPLIIRRTSHHSPITINIKPGIFKPFNFKPPLLSPLSLRKKIKKPLISSVRAPKLPKLPIPKLPKLPLIPIIPPIPKLPLLPLPLLPLLPPLLPPIPSLNKLKPIRVPILGKTKLQKTLASEIKPLKLSSLNINKKKKVKDKLLKLRKDGILTTPQLLRLKKILL